MTDNGYGYGRSAFANALRQHMKGWPGFAGDAFPMWANWTDGIYGDYRALAGKMVKADSVKLHGYAGHLLSSQAFAFNLFLPFREGNRKGLSQRVSSLIGDELTVDRVAFEWVPPGHVLCEIDGEQPGLEERATAVDVALWGWLPNGRRAVVLVEVKLSENGFTQCNGRTSAGNRRKDVCRSARLFFEEPQDCYLRRPIREKRTGVIGRYSLEAAATCKTPSPTPISTGNVPSPTTCSSPTGASCY